MKKNIAGKHYVRGTPFSLRADPAPPHGERRREVEARLPEGSRDSSGVEPSSVGGEELCLLLRFAGGGFGMWALGM